MRFSFRLAFAGLLLNATPTVGFAENEKLLSTSAPTDVAGEEFPNGPIKIIDPNPFVYPAPTERIYEELDLDPNLDWICRATIVRPANPGDRSCVRGYSYCIRIDCFDRDTGVADSEIHPDSRGWHCYSVSCS